MLGAHSAAPPPIQKAKPLTTGRTFGTTSKNKVSPLKKRTVPLFVFGSRDYEAEFLKVVNPHSHK